VIGGDAVDPHRWLTNFPSTQATVLVGDVCAVFYVVCSMIGSLTGHPVDGGTHAAIAGFITLLVSGNFAIKRATDRDLAEVRARGKAAGRASVTVEAPSTVEVTQGSPKE
jgi:hypothetical protein